MGVRKYRSFPQRRKEAKESWISTLLFCALAANSINARLAGRPGFPAFVNPEPLARITPDLVFNSLSHTECQPAHVFLFIVSTFNRKRRLDDQQVLSFFFTPRGKEWNDGRVCSQSEFRHKEIRGGRHAKEVDKNSLVVQRIQVGQQPQSSFTRAQDSEHRATGGQLVESF